MRVDARAGCAAKQGDGAARGALAQWRKLSLWGRRFRLPAIPVHRTAAQLGSGGPEEVPLLKPRHETPTPRQRRRRGRIHTREFPKWDGLPAATPRPR